MKKAAFFCKNGPRDREFDSVFGFQRRTWMSSRVELLSEVVTPQNFDSLAMPLNEVEVIFATWGMWNLTPAQLQQLPALKAVFYAAGSVKYFAEPLLKRGIVVTSAWVANAIPVAEFTLGQILLANKGYFRNMAEYRDTDDYSTVFRGRGNYGTTISILGVGQVGRRLIDFLRPFRFKVVVFDPYLSYKGAEILGVKKVETLEEAFGRGDITTNHLADLPATYGFLRGSHFASMPNCTTFINTGRGRTVNHEELLHFLKSRPDVTALLDVTDPEPLPLSHPLRALPNAHISGHIAGSIGHEVVRMADFALEDFERWQSGVPLLFAVSLEMLDTMA